MFDIHTHDSKRKILSNTNNQSTLICFEDDSCFAANNKNSKAII